jgi:hypothetical protein
MTAPELYETRTRYLAAHLIARGETLLAYDEQTGIFTFAPEAAELARRLERMPKRTGADDRRLFEKKPGGGLRRR